jgi:hypothetical protein
MATFSVFIYLSSLSAQGIKKTPQTLQSGVGRLILAKLSLEILFGNLMFPTSSGLPAQAPWFSKTRLPDSYL